MGKVLYLAVAAAVPGFLVLQYTSSASTPSLGVILGVGQSTSMKSVWNRATTQAVLAASLLESTTVYAQRQEILDLSSLAWTLSSPNFSYISVPGRVPSQVHLDLRAAKVYCAEEVQCEA